MTRSFVFAVALALLGSCALPGRAHAKAFRGETEIFIPLSDETRFIGDTHLMLRWRVWSLMGEPVVYCQAAWIAEPEILRARLDEPEAPDEVLRRASLVSVYVATSVMTQEKPGFLWEQQSVWMPCDVGAMTKVFLGSVKQFQALPEREKEPYFSYNAPESPSWGTLFKVGNSNVPAGRAKSILKQHGLRLYEVPGWGKAVVKAKLLAWALGLWRSEQRSARLAEERKRVEAERQERRRQAYGTGDSSSTPSPPAREGSGDFWSTPHTQAKTEATDFWSAPDDPLTVEERKEDLQFQATQSEISAAAASHEADQRRQQELIAAKQRELERRTSDKWCDEVSSKVSQCIYDACGSRPSRSLGLTVCPVDDRCCGMCSSDYTAPPEGCESYCYEVKQARRERARELESKQDDWDRCADRERPDCGPEGFVDVPTCQAEMKAFRESMARGFRD